MHAEFVSAERTPRVHESGFVRFPASVIAEARGRGISSAQLLDLDEAWWATHWEPPASLSEVVEQVLL